MSAMRGNRTLVIGSVEPRCGYNEMLRMGRRSEWANQSPLMTLRERRPLNPFTFKEIRFSVRELANFSGAFSVLAVEGASYPILSSGEGHDRSISHKANGRNGWEADVAGLGGWLPSLETAEGGEIEENRHDQTREGHQRPIQERPFFASDFPAFGRCSRGDASPDLEQPNAPADNQNESSDHV